MRTERITTKRVFTNTIRAFLLIGWSFIGIIAGWYRLERVWAKEIITRALRHKYMITSRRETIQRKDSNIVQKRYVSTGIKQEKRSPGLYDINTR
jgi:hypothetical protein